MMSVNPEYLPGYIAYIESHSLHGRWGYGQFCICSCVEEKCCEIAERIPRFSKCYFMVVW